MKQMDLGLLGLVVKALDTTGVVDGDGVVVFEDHTGNRLGVDTDNGIVYRVTGSGERKVFATQDTSSKADGRLVAVFNYISDEGIFKPYRITQYQLVALVAHRKEFDTFVKLGIKPYACHINSTPWDCRADNIEWGLPRWNAWQGKLGASLQHYYPGKYTEVYLREYTRGAKQGTFKEVITLRKGITNKNVTDFISATGADLVIHRGTEDKYYPLDVVDSFIAFMKRNNNW